jgi:hypothetical protein
MAKTSASGTTNSWVALLAKHHFWLLALAVPLVLVPMLSIAQGALKSEIAAVQAQIKGYIDSMKAVRRIPQHPNESWSNDIDSSTMRVKRETFREWERFWESQQSLRVWPELLGEQFVKAAATLRPDGKLAPILRERYQNNVLQIVRELPGRMGVASGMSEKSDPSGGLSSAPSPRPRPEPAAGGLDGRGVPVFEESPYFLSWAGENQQRIADSFNWEEPPTPAKILLAQEELWVYGLLCDMIAQFNKPATGPHNAPISRVDTLYVGYPAAEDNPGGAAGGRVTGIAVGGPAGGGPAADGPGGPGGPPGEGGGAAGRPPHPRFSGGQSGGGPAAPPPPGDPAEGVAPVSPDDMLRNWIYVDFSGKPLDVAQLAAAVDSQMVHLMPFVLKVVIDQRQIDPLLVALSQSAIPIDVRQLRINAGETAVSGSGRGGPSQSEPAAGAPSGDGRYHDVTLELRGTVGLATSPREEVVGLEKGQASSEAPGKPAAPPKDASSGILPRRRQPT